MAVALMGVSDQSESESIARAFVNIYSSQSVLQLQIDSRPERVASNCDSLPASAAADQHQDSTQF